MRKVRFKLNPDDFEQHEGWVADVGCYGTSIVIIDNKKIAKLYLEGEDWLDTPEGCCIWIVTPDAIIEEMEDEE